MSKTDSDKGTIQELAKKNLPYILGIIFSILTLYTANLLSPLKQDIRALAAQVDSVEAQIKDIMLNGTRQETVNEERIRSIDSKLDDIKTRQTDMDNKIDRILEKK